MEEQIRVRSWTPFKDARGEEVVNKFAQGASVQDLCKEFCAPRKTIYEILDEHNITRRRRRVTREDSAKVCGRCHKAVKVDGASFCPYCGADIRSREEILKTRVDNIRKYVYLFPEAQRDDVVQLLNDITSYLGEK